MNTISFGKLTLCNVNPAYKKDLKEIIENITDKNNKKVFAQGAKVEEQGDTVIITSNNKNSAKQPRPEWGINTRGDEEEKLLQDYLCGPVHNRLCKGDTLFESSRHESNNKSAKTFTRYYEFKG